MRIFLGLTEIANILNNYAKGFRALGHDVVTIVDHYNKFYPDAQYDFVLDKQKPTNCINTKLAQTLNTVVSKASGIRLLPELVKKCDVFLFTWGTSFMPGFGDYKIIKQAGKKIVSTFWGSDIRYWHALKKEMEEFGVEGEIEPFIDFVANFTQYKSTYKAKRRIVAAAERYSDLILSQPGFGQLQTRPYMRAIAPLDLSEYKFEIPNRIVPLILHAPSRRGVKGTDYVLQAMEKLKQEGIPFTFRLIENMPNPEVRKELTEADILVDELYSETIGVLSAEAMASGTVTLVRYMPDYAGVPSGCPAVNVTKDTLVDRLRNIIIDRSLRQRLAEAGRPYVELNNNHIEIARNILHWLKQDVITQYDFTPSFYQTYIPPRTSCLPVSEKNVHS